MRALQAAPAKLNVQPVLSSMTRRAVLLEAPATVHANAIASLQGTMHASSQAQYHAETQDAKISSSGSSKTQVLECILTNSQRAVYYNHEVSKVTPQLVFEAEVVIMQTAVFRSPGHMYEQTNAFMATVMRGPPAVCAKMMSSSVIAHLARAT